MTNDTIGVDISKDHLDAHRMSDGASRRFPNDSAGHGAFVNWLDRSGARIVYEPTGPYHRAFERKLAADGFALVKVNPRQARRFAEATGRLWRAWAHSSTSRRGRRAVRSSTISRTCTWPARRW